MKVNERAWIVMASALVMVLAGCTDTTDGAPDPVPSLSRWGPALSEEDAYARIPLEGTEQVPLYWELPVADSEETAAAVLAARRFQALDEYSFSQPKPHAEAYLYQWIATERMIGVYYPDGTPDPDQPSRGQAKGPVWLRVLDVEQRTDRLVRVTICRDLGWRGEVDGSVELPRPNRARHHHYDVVRQRTDGANERWLVNKVWADWDEVDSGLRRECEDWATHDPE